MKYNYKLYLITHERLSFRQRYESPSDIYAADFSPRRFNWTEYKRGALYKPSYRDDPIRFSWIALCLMPRVCWACRRCGADVASHRMHPTTGNPVIFIPSTFAKRMHAPAWYTYPISTRHKIHGKGGKKRLRGAGLARKFAFEYIAAQRWKYILNVHKDTLRC